MGIIYSRQGLNSGAPNYFKQALNHQALLEYSHNNALADIYNSIAYAYTGLDSNDEALANLQEAERILTREYLASAFWQHRRSKSAVGNTPRK
ncbi:unnamed protein product [Didymodactylos carnosus]|uniref:Uncharacterized protein n=1 Tax=Didymodactylos carnosus TaxID=1234261 RepID=A0A814PF59_9BILA|nr:unnamed protein product [Didymodactylos carnosus]CAF3868599.1 unnamed protein product [Didymodactylos carnosus]